MRTYLIVALLIGGMLLVFDSVIQQGETKASEQPAYKVMVLGFDGVDPEFLEYLIEAGKLPNFARLMREGAYAPCQSFKPTKSVVIWTSIATGKRMEKHGIIDWMLLSEGRRDKVLATGNVRRTEAMWNIATSAGKSVQILNWWATWPTETVNGEMVSNHYPKPRGDRLADVTYPMSLVEELAPLRDISRVEAETLLQASGIPVYAPEIVEATFRPTDNFVRQFVAATGHFVEDLLIERIAHHLLESRGQRDLFGVIFRNIDIYSHFLWRFIDRRVAERTFQTLMADGAPMSPEVEMAMNDAYARVLEPVYVHEDQRLGRLMKQAGPETVVLVVSDHGFQFRPYGFYHYGLDAGGGTLAPPGVIFLWGPPVRAGVRMKTPTVFDVTPTLLYLMGLPVGKDMDGRVLTEVLSPQLLKRRPVAWVASHDTGERGGKPLPSDIDQDILEELRTLGYVQ